MGKGKKAVKGAAAKDKKAAKQDAKAVPHQVCKQVDFVVAEAYCCRSVTALLGSAVGTA